VTFDLWSMNRGWLGSILALAVSLALPGLADACSCMWSPNTCASIREADAVLEATVESIELEIATARSNGTRPPDYARERLVTLRDVKMLKGDLVSVIRTPSDGAACGYEFRAGTRYLIVASRDPAGRVIVFSCGLTRPLAEARALLDYLAGDQATPRQIHVWGNVSAAGLWGNNAYPSVPVPDVAITLSGPHTVTTRTAADGRFSLVGLAPGKYVATARPPSSAPGVDSIQSLEFEVDATKQSCAELPLSALIAGGITGTLVDADGQPVANAFVELKRADDASAGLQGMGSMTDSAGRFAFSNIPAGHFIVGVALTGQPSGRAPFVPARAKTVDGHDVVRVERGASIALRPLVVQPLKEVVVPTVIIRRDGKPPGVTGLNLQMLDIASQYNSRQERTDAEGRINLKLWAGQRYRLTVGRGFDADADLEFVASDRALVITLQRP
jgi:5-hydroxyisourate hydrolase-like protein (transthyretin family)